MKNWPDNIVADRHEITGKWTLQYLTEAQAEKCRAVLMAKDIGAKIPVRSPEMLKLRGLSVNESVIAADQATAHRYRIYLSRLFGKGAGAMRAEDGHYRVWRQL